MKGAKGGEGSKGEAKGVKGSKEKRRGVKHILY